MRHGMRGRKLGRTASHKKAMFNNMAASLFEHGSIRTTYAKAKELRGVADRLITFAKRGDLSARRQVLRRIRNKVVVARLFDEIGPSFTDRQGGYTRVLKLGPRRGDSTEICLVELVGEELRADYAAKSEAARTARPAPAETATEQPAETEAPPDDTPDTPPKAEVGQEGKGEKEEKEEKEGS